MKIKALKEKKNALIDEMQSLVNACETETRSMNETEDARFKQIEAEINQIDADIAEQRSLASEAVIEDKNTEKRGNEMDKE